MRDNEPRESKEFSMRFWNYYCALEFDFKNISRYIAFSDDNVKTHSIELTRILLSSCSEIDVLLKEICSELDEDHKAKKIKDDATKGFYTKINYLIRPLHR